MPIKFACPKCKNVLQVSSKLAGKTGKCKCGNPVTIPSPKPAAAQAGGAAKQAAASQASAAMFDELTESDFSRQSPDEALYFGKTENNDAETLQRFTYEQSVEAEKQAGAARGVLKFMSIINIAVAIFAVVLIVFYAAVPDMITKLEDFIPILSVGQSIGIAFFSLSALVLIAGAIGIFSGKSWGWILTASAFVFMAVERAGTIGFVFKNGFNAVGFYSAMIPLVGVLFANMFLFKSETQELCRIKKAIPSIIAALLGLIAGGVMLALMFQNPPAPK